MTNALIRQGFRRGPNHCRHRDGRGLQPEGLTLEQSSTRTFRLDGLRRGACLDSTAPPEIELLVWRPPDWLDDVEVHAIFPAGPKPSAKGACICGLP